MAGAFRRADLRFRIFLMFMVAFMHDATCARLEPGKEKFTLATSRNMPFAMRAVMKSMFENTAVKISIAADVFCTTSFTVGWELRYTRCAQFYLVKSGELLFEELFKDPSAMYSVEPEISVMGNESIVYNCEEVTSDAVQPQFPPSNVTTCYVPPGSSKRNCTKGTLVDIPYWRVGSTGVSGRRKRDTGPESQEMPVKSGSTQGDDQKKSGSQEDPKKHVVALTPVTGSYLVMLNISAIGEEGGVSFNVTVDMKGPHGYLSATQYPLLVFYEVMTGLDALLAFIWLFLLYCHYQNLVGIHIWIGVVIFSTLVEAVAFYAEFKHMNNNGTESSTGILLAELVSCVQRTLARLLTLFISFGYGFTKNTLGRDTKYVVTFGLLYMTLSTAEAVIRVSESYEHGMVVVLPLSVLEFILLIWIIRGLRRTSLSLRLANEEAKLQRYRLFMAIAVLCVVSSVIFSTWSMKTHRFSECVENSNTLWLDDAFWHILFHLILFVIMIVCRPQNPRMVHIKLLKVNVFISDDKKKVNVKTDSTWKAVKDVEGDS